MSGENVRKFDEIAEKLLDQLAVAFPIPVDVSASSLGLKESKKSTYDPVTETRIGGEPMTEDEKYLQPTIAWLIQSGYIHGDKTQFGYLRLVLTERGLDLLRVRPRSLNAR
jgi:hypothetical protein